MSVPYLHDLRRSALFLALLCLGSGGLHAQERNFNWVFSAGVWLQFTADTLVSLPLADTISHRNACISDTAGQFLLLADDFGIRNALFEIVEGGSAAELGWNVPAGNYLVLPMPGQAERYAVFINELPPSARAGMVEVDMAANGGAGTVVGNTLWYMQNTTAKLTATTDSAEAGYWVLQHGDDDDTFNAFHLGDNGLNLPPVTSQAGTVYLPNTAPKNNMDRRGQMNFNFQGTMLGLIKNGPSIDTSKVELFLFDRSTGEVAFWTDIGPEYVLFPGEGSLIDKPWMQGIDFDHSGRYMYTCHMDTSSFVWVNTVVQYDLMASLDSLTDHTKAMASFAVATAAYDGIFGTDIATTPQGYSRPSWPSSEGYLFFRWSQDPMANFPDGYNQPTRLFKLPQPISTLMEYLYLPNTQLLGGLPSPCKRYFVNDSLGTDIAIHTVPQVVGIRPNPMEERAVLVFNGLAWPEEVVWRDALGRVLKRTAVERLGPSFVLERDGLPTGLYMVEVLGRKGSLGVVKVVCQ